MSDNVSRGEQAAEEVARRWIATMQSMGDQIARQQQTFKADDAGSDEQLHPTPEHPALLRLSAAAAGGATSHGTGLPSSLGAVDAVSSTAAADLPTDVPTVDGAGSSPTAGFPAGGPAVVERLHGPL